MLVLIGIELDVLEIAGVIGHPVVGSVRQFRRFSFLLARAWIQFFFGLQIHVKLRALDDEVNRLIFHIGWQAPSQVDRVLINLSCVPDPPFHIQSAADNASRVNRFFLVYRSTFPHPIRWSHPRSFGVAVKIIEDLDFWAIPLRIEIK